MSSSSPREIELRDEWLLPESEFSQLDWMAVYAWVDSEIESGDELDFLLGIVRLWILEIGRRLGDGYRLVESDHFMLVSVASDEKAVELLQFLELSYSQIRASLPCLVEEEPDGKCPVLVIADHDRFYDYLDDFIGDGASDYAAVSGVFLNRGWGHFALPSADLREYRGVFSHELSHALVSPLLLPMWLDEAIAMTVEDSITKCNPYILNRELIEQHQGYWNEELIQSFWTGESFSFPDDGQGLSYHLAQFILKALYQGGSTAPELINEFILAAADSKDAGYSAALDVLGIDLGELLERLLGAGAWEPVAQPRVVVD